MSALGQSRGGSCGGGKLGTGGPGSARTRWTIIMMSSNGHGSITDWENHTLGAQTPPGLRPPVHLWIVDLDCATILCSTYRSKGVEDIFSRFQAVCFFVWIWNSDYRPAALLPRLGAKWLVDTSKQPWHLKLSWTGPEPWNYSGFQYNISVCIHPDLWCIGRIMNHYWFLISGSHSKILKIVMDITQTTFISKSPIQSLKSQVRGKGLVLGLNY